jgi:hypothetical protein
MMENIQKNYAGDEINRTNQSSAIGLIIRQKESKVLERLPMNGSFICRAGRAHPSLESVFYRVLPRLPNESFLGRIEHRRLTHEKAILRKTENSGTSTVSALREELPSCYAGRRGTR